MAKMEKINFLSEIATKDAPTNSGCIRNIWLGTVSDPSTGFTTTANFYHNGQFVSDWTENQTVNFYGDPQFSVYACPVPDGVKTISIFSRQFYDSTPGTVNTMLDALRCLIALVNNDGKFACDREQLSGSMSPDYGVDPNNPPRVIDFAGTITINLPNDVKVSYILINTGNRNDTAPVVTYHEDIGQDGDIYIQYIE